MPMMNSEARKRAKGHRIQDADRASDPLAVVRLLADLWDERASREEVRGNGFAAVILRNHADELRATLGPAARTA